MVCNIIFECNTFGQNKRRYLIIAFFALLAINIFAEEITNSDYTFIYKMNNNEDIQLVFNKIKTFIAKNNHYYCAIRNAEDGNEKTEIFAILKPVTNEIYNYTVYQCIFYSKGKRIDLILSDNEILGLTSPYSEDGREQVFQRFYDFYRYNVLKIYP